MANTAGMATSFKGELLNGVHQFGSPTIVSRTSLTAPTADTFKAALFLASASITAATTTYTTTGELAGTGNYTQGGVTTVFIAPSTSGTGALTTPNASFAWTNLTSSGSFDCVQVYNSTQGNKTVSVHTFSAQSITAGNFTLTMPANTTGNALIQIV